MIKNKTTNWFIPLRLAQYIVIFGVFSLWLHFPQIMLWQIVLYSFLTLSFSLFYVFDKQNRFYSVSQVLVALQFMLELVIEAGIVYATGNVNSPFSVLFLLTIISAALVYRLTGTLVYASIVSLLYTVVIWLGFSSNTQEALSQQSLKTIFSSQDYLFYSIFLHILIFYLVAFISGFLAERLRQRDEELATTSRELKQARLETDEILQNLNSGLLTVNASGRLVYFNLAAERILEFAEDDIKGLKAIDIFAERMPLLGEALEESLHNIEALPRKEISIRTTKGEEFPIGFSTSVLTDENGQMRGIVAIFSDLTDAKKMEEKIRVSDRLAAIGELSASIAHEIRNPLAAISGSVELLKTDLDVVGENQRLMNLIIKESDRLTTILNEFLLYARIDRPTYAKIELCHLISEVFEITRHHNAYHKGIALSLDTTEALVYIVGDEGLCKQLLLNLVVNACEAINKDHGTVTLSIKSSPRENSIILIVSDTGPGIDSETRKEMYTPFFSTKKTGTGLGLAIVHRICTTLKIDLEVHSDPGYGTQFILTFPSLPYLAVDKPAVKTAIS